MMCFFLWNSFLWHIIVGQCRVNEMYLSLSHFINLRVYVCVHVLYEYQQVKDIPKFQ